MKDSRNLGGCAKNIHHLKFQCFKTEGGFVCVLASHLYNDFVAENEEKKYLLLALIFLKNES